MDFDRYTELQLLEALEAEPETSQADLAAKVGVAVGTVNWYIKRWSAKGYIKVKRIGRWRWRYLLAPIHPVPFRRLLPIASVGFFAIIATENGTNVQITYNGHVLSGPNRNAVENITLNDLGRAKSIRVTKDETTIIKGSGKEADIKSRISQIKRLFLDGQQHLEPLLIKDLCIFSQASCHSDHRFVMFQSQPGHPERGFPEAGLCIHFSFSRNDQVGLPDFFFKPGGLCDHVDPLHQGGIQEGHHSGP